MGAPGLALETWDPSNQSLLETPTLFFFMRGQSRPAGDVTGSHLDAADPARFCAQPGGGPPVGFIRVPQ